MIENMPLWIHVKVIIQAKHSYSHLYNELQRIKAILKSFSRLQTS